MSHYTPEEIDRILEKMDDGFMRPDIQKMRFDEYTDEFGDTVSVPSGHAPEGVEIESTTVSWGARLSAPGYLDCTEWSTFRTERGAMEYLAETYGDDSEPDEPDEPNEPDEPDEPDEPNEPNEPDEPDEPDEPTQPIGSCLYSWTPN